MKKLTSNLPAFLSNYGPTLPEAAELVQDLRDAGFDVVSVWQFVHTGDSYPEAIPIFLRHLQKPYSANVKESIIRALTTKEARGVATQALLDEYHRLPENEEYWHTRWLIGNYMYYNTEWEDLDQVVAIVVDPENGQSRHLFIRSLGKWKRPEKRAEVLAKAGQALEQIAKEDAKEYIRKEAEKALERLKR